MPSASARNARGRRRGADPRHRVGSPLADAPNGWPRCTAERREHRMPRNARGPRGSGNRGMGDRPMDEMAEPGAEMGTPEEGDETMDTGEMEGGSMPRRRVVRRRARR